ncbi:hypothetical protein [Natrialba magadii]|nr:hypothetical protein [Natrialba magadii]
MSDWTPTEADLDPDDFRDGLISAEDLRNGNIHTHEDVLHELDDE